MLTALVVSPHPTVPGGVSVFIEAMKRHAARSRMEPFYVGRGITFPENVLGTVLRLMVTPLKMARVVIAGKFDVVHLNPTFDIKSLVRDGLLLTTLHLIGFKRVLLYFHGWDSTVHKRLLHSKWLARFVRTLLNKACLITVLSSDFQDGLRALGVDDARIVVTRTMFDGTLLKAVRDEPRQATRDFILFMSRFDPEKGGGQLLRAFGRLASDYPELDLVMAGDGEQRGYLHAEAKRLGIDGRVIFCGYVTGVEKDRLLRDCLIFALPTFYRSEGMPVSVLEGMGAGKPLLVGSVGALRSVVCDLLNGVVLDTVNDQTVEAGLRRLLADPTFAAWAGNNNAQLAWSRYEATAVTAEIEDLYQRVARC